MKLLPVLGAGLALVGLSLASQAFLFRHGPAEPRELSTVPGTLALEPVQLLHAQPFTLAVPAVHTYRAERPSYSAGLVLVLHADESFVTPRQALEPVLYLGAETAERLNTGRFSGNLVVLVPNARLADLATEPLFFGVPALPEEIDATLALLALSAARAAGAGPIGFPPAQPITPAVIAAYDYTDLATQVSTLIETYSPAETDLVNGLRVERLFPH